jgi:hypothetical protein
MKNLLLILALAIGIQTSANNTSLQVRLNISQPNGSGPSFSFLRGHKQGYADYALQWSMSTTSGIDHYEIQSTYEDPFDEYSNWTSEGIVTGNRSNIIKFTHHDVLPGLISYRVLAILSNAGPAIVSDIYTTSID